MTRDGDTLKLTDETTIKMSNGELGVKEREILHRAGIFLDSRETDGVVTDVRLDFSRLGRIAYEHHLLKKVASQIEIEILDAFESASDSVLTTKQLVERTGRPTSSVSRALGRLSDTRWVEKVQDGVYRYSR